MSYLTRAGSGGGSTLLQSYKGAFSPTALYAAGDVVTYLGGTYLAKTAVGPAPYTADYSGRADGALTDGWLPSGHAWTISGGKIRAGGGTVATVESQFGIVRPAQAGVQDITAVIAADQGSTNNRPGINFGLAASSGATSGFMAFLNSANTVALRAYNNPNRTLASFDNVAFPSGMTNAGAPTTLRVTFDPSTNAVAVYINGTQVISTTHAGYSGQYFGLAVSGSSPLLFNSFSVANNTPIAFSAADWNVIAPSSDTTAAHLKGAWSSTATYAVGDQVTNSYGLYAALAAVPSGQTAPSANPSYTPTASIVFSTRGATAAAGGDNTDDVYMNFTTGASSVTVDTVRLKWGADGSAANFNIGVSSSVGASPSAVTFLSSVIGVGGAAGSTTVHSIPSITLAANTTYSLVLTSRDASRTGNAGGRALGYVNGAPVTATGGSAASISGGANYVNGGTSSTAWVGSFAAAQPLWSLEQAGNLPYWSKIANLGADPATNINKGAWSSAATYNAGDQVTRSYGLYAALLAVPINADPLSVPAVSTVGSVSDFNATNSLSSYVANAYSGYQPFTTGATGATVSSVTLSVSGTKGATDAVRVGITATQPSGAESAATVIGGFSASTALPASGQVSVTLAGPVTLAPNTTYYLVVQGSVGTGALAVATNSAAGPTGIVASATVGYLAASGGAWSAFGNTSIRIPFALSSTATTYWQKIANLGADPALALPRTTATYTTASIAAAASATGTVTLGKSYRLLTLQTTVAARVRIYTTAAKRDADLSRAVGTAAGSNSGLLLEYVTTDATVQELSPVVDGFNNESPVTTAAAISVTNNSATAAAVGVTLGYLGTE